MSVTRALQRLCLHSYTHDGIWIISVGRGTTLVVRTPGFPGLSANQVSYSSMTMRAGQVRLR